MENLNYKNKQTEKKYLNNNQKNQFLKVKIVFWELEKGFIELKDSELKNREAKIIKEIELFFKLIFVSIDDIDNFEQKEMRKVRPIKNIWYDWLINYIPEPIRKSVDDFQDKVNSLCKTKSPKQIVYGRGKKLSKPKTQKQSEEKKKL